jgi:NSS family neurotransmitter:Na+ symporter
MGIWSGFTLFGKGILDLVAFVTSSIMLPVGGLLIALFVGWAMGPRAVAELRGDADSRPRLGAAWLFILRFVAPVAIAWILINEVIASG